MSSLDLLRDIDGPAAQSPRAYAADENHARRELKRCEAWLPNGQQCSSFTRHPRCYRHRRQADRARRADE